MPPGLRGRCLNLGLADLEHLGSAGWALALGCGSAVLHRDLLWVRHLALGLALHAVGFHTFLPLRPVGLCWTPKPRSKIRLIVNLSAVGHYYNIFNLSLVQMQLGPNCRVVRGLSCVAAEGCLT